MSTSSDQGSETDMDVQSEVSVNYQMKMSVYIINRSHNERLSYHCIQASTEPKTLTRIRNKVRTTDDYFIGAIT